MTSPHPRRWWALGALSVVLIVIGLDLIVLSVALPTLATDLHASTTQLQWFSNAYTLVLAALLLPAGLLGDRLGQKRLLMGALALFGGASAWCAFAASPGQLIVARAALGVGAAFLIPLSMSLVTVLFPREERAKALTIWVMANSLGIPLGPVLGGWLLDNFAWGSVFLINVPLVLIGLVSVVFLIPSLRGSGAGRIDLAGIALSSAGLVALTYGFVRIGETSWSDGLSWLAVVAGVLLLTAFGFWQRRVSAPLVDTSLFRSREYTWGAVLATVSSFAMMGLIFVLPQLFQAVEGADALITGLRLLPIIGGLLVGAKVAERLAERAGPRGIVIVGFILMTGGFALGATTSAADGYGFVAVWETLIGLSLGFTMPTVTAMAMSAMSDARAGSGSAMIQALRQVGGTIGVAVLGTVLNSGYRDAVDVTGLPGPAAEAARGSASGAAAVAQQLNSPGLLASARDAFVSGMDATLWTSAGFGVLGILLSVVFLPRQVKEAAQSEHDFVAI
ncbi:DHA2 family efflux MFS transporter permease subunit [Amycolatopsis sp. NPDC059657]|uniref:DHA2 family efflux MFS transporter permease subunit n=1 Tax=Amycolatopsis sp. NPDC059657 TaxID=3346899 RepID=UPI00366BFDFB